MRHIYKLSVVSILALGLFAYSSPAHAVIPLIKQGMKDQKTLEEEAKKQQEQEEGSQDSQKSSADSGKESGDANRPVEKSDQSSAPGEISE